MTDSSIKKIFISHRSVDKELADCFVDFLLSIGIPSEIIFCSSLPGNDVQSIINTEIRMALHNSVVDIVLLSRDYYNSIYCLNEIGIIWFKNGSNKITIALPEITENNMLGFYSSEFKIRRLNDESDILGIFDLIRKSLQLKDVSIQSVSRQAKKLISLYQTKLASRSPSSLVINPIDLNLVTEEEQIILYYCASSRKHRVNVSSVEAWLIDNEIEPFSIDDTFDLLYRSGYGQFIEENKIRYFLLNVSLYKTLIAPNADLTELKKIFNNRIRASVERFSILWDNDKFDEADKLFILYIVEERICSFGDRWMAEGQIESIKHWEGKNSLDDSLSKDYGACLNLFIENKLVFPSSYTSHSNPREYTLMKSIKEFLLDGYLPLYPKLLEIKKKHVFDLPF